jgi:unsaturated chondroitin disaccharide hydrolase
MLLEAAKTISERFQTLGYMKSFGLPGDSTYPFTTIDDVINLCIPLWYAKATDDKSLTKAALDAANLIGDRLIRPDGSTIQVLLFDEHGAPTGVDTYQGSSPAGCWSRGLAWGIYGFAIMAGISNEARHLAWAQLMADYWIEHVQEDPSPIWDFELSANSPEPHDSFAATLAYAGLIELAALSSEPRAQQVKSYVAQQMSKLSDKYVLSHDGPGIVGGAALDVPHKHGVGTDAAVIVGDSYYVETLWRLLNGKTEEPIIANKGARDQSKLSDVTR